jgi:hypothetical protein
MLFGRFLEIFLHLRRRLLLREVATPGPPPVVGRGGKAVIGRIEGPSEDASNDSDQGKGEEGGEGAVQRAVPDARGAAKAVVDFGVVGAREEEPGP